MIIASKGQANHDEQMIRTDEEAVKKAALAFYKQTGLERRVNGQVRIFKNLYLSSEVEKASGWVFWIGDVLIQGRVYYSIRWEF